MMTLVDRLAATLGFCASPRNRGRDSVHADIKSLLDQWFGFALALVRQRKNKSRY